MIPASNVAKGIAVLAAVALHAGGVIYLWTAPTARIASQAGAAEARIGNSFADMAAGRLVSVPASTLADGTETAHAPRKPPERIKPLDHPVEPAEAIAPERALVRPKRGPTNGTVTSPPTLEAAEPVVAPAEVPKGDLIALSVLRPAEVLQPERLEPDHSERKIAPLKAVSAHLSTPERPLEALDVAAAAPTPERDAAPSTDPAETLKAEDVPGLAPERSVRPPARAKQVTGTVVATPTEAPSRRGNSAEDGRQGSVTGVQMAATSRQGHAKAQGRETGNAAAANYAGLVLQKISSVPRPEFATEATAVVRFQIAPGGNLAALSLDKSSGSGRLDRVALGIVRRAAPFPAPPPGANRDFRIRIGGS